MGQIENIFFNNPSKLFHGREISRITKIPKSTVSLRLKELLKEGLIKEDCDVFKGYRANDSADFRRKKIIVSMDQIYFSGLIDYLYAELYPQCIILFGSIVKGEYTSQSDIDIFLECEEKNVDLSKYEKILGKKIQLFFKEKFSDLPGTMKNNLLNGFVMDGFVKAF